MTRLTIGLAAVMAASVLATALISAGTGNAFAAEPDAPAVYEFLKATDDRVWRLNRQTGEIAVCTLEREALVCSTSSGAAETPATSYEALQQQRAAAAAEREAKEVRERKRALNFLERMMALFREFAEDSPPAEQPAEK